jgi:hypothetical protein
MLERLADACSIREWKRHPSGVVFFPDTAILIILIRTSWVLCLESSV